MSKLGFLLPCVLVLVGLSVLGCGNPRQLQSISISPRTADAQSFPNGRVQFVATGTFTDGSTVSPLTARWTINGPWTKAPTLAGVDVDGDGVGQCTTFVGAVLIVATAPIDVSLPVSKLTMTTKQVSGIAQLTCP